MADPTPTPTNPAAAAKQVVTQLRGLWTKLPKLGRVGAIAVLALVIGGVAYAALSSSSSGWVAVAPAMNAEDVTDVSRELNERGIPYRLTAGRKGVEVPTARLDEAKMFLASRGLPRSSRAQDYYDKIDIGSSGIKERALLDEAALAELEHSIESMGPIESARVHISRGRQSMVVEAEIAPTAAVLVQLRPGSTLSADQVRGVQALVKTAVPGLTADQVAVIDGRGNVLGADDEQAPVGADSAAEEAKIAQKVRDMLVPIVGEGHFAVTVAVEMDRRKVTKQEESFDPATAIRSTNRTVTPAASAQMASGVSGTQGNLPNGGAGGGAGAGAGSNTGTVINEIVNNEVGRTVIETVEPEVRVGKIQVAILVDHLADGSPRPQAELDRIINLAHAAAGLDDQRGDKLALQSFPFAAEPPVAPPLPSIEPAGSPLPLPVPLPIAAAGAGGLLLLIVLFFVVLAIRRARKRKRAAVPVLALPAPLAEIEKALDAPADAPAVPQLGAAASDQRSLEERVLGTIRADIPRAARVLAGWLAQPDPRPSK